MWSKIKLIGPRRLGLCRNCISDEVTLLILEVRSGKPLQQATDIPVQQILADQASAEKVWANTPDQPDAQVHLKKPPG